MNKKREEKSLVPLSIPVIRQPGVFDLHLPSPPKKLPKPTVPRYRYDKVNNQIIEPPQEIIKAIIASLKKRRVIGRAQKEKIKEVYSVKDEEVALKLEAVHKRLQDDIERAEQRMQIDREREDIRISKEQELEKLKKRLKKSSRKP